MARKGISSATRKMQKGQKRVNGAVRLLEGSKAKTDAQKRRVAKKFMSNPKGVRNKAWKTATAKLQAELKKQAKDFEKVGQKMSEAMRRRKNTKN